ncbi:hypothetical protein KJ660_00835 [Candidatus Micrarchaeota archaeon]|nr:hypothetical protein [Candidatus Micrarchaeota archaeon]
MVYRNSELSQVFRALFFFLAGIILITFFFITFIEGILVQLEKESAFAAVYYFVSLCCIAATYWTYLKAKAVLRTI